jgi:hypothetical protein
MNVKTLPPRQAPAMAMPVVQLPSTPIPAGHGRVVIDTTDGPMEVVAQTEGTFTGGGGSRSGFLCRTPCVVDLPLGSYKLFFSGLAHDEARGDVAPLHVQEGLNVLRRAPGKYESPKNDPVLGGLLLVTGTVLLTTGTVMIAADEVPGGIALGTVGLGAGIGGAVVATPSPAEEQAGTTTAWNVPPQRVEAPPQPAPVPPPQPPEVPQPTEPPATGSTAP